MNVAPSTVAEIVGAPNFPALIEAYAAESATMGMPSPSAKLETYPQLERAGLLHALAAWDEGALVGFITVLAAPLPHYGMSVAVSESFFVDKAHRGLAGLKLLSDAEAKARAIGSPGFYVSAPIDSRLAALLPKVGYAPSNIIFFKRLSDA